MQTTKTNRPRPVTSLGSRVIAEPPTPEQLHQRITDSSAQRAATARTGNHTARRAATLALATALLTADRHGLSGGARW